MTVDSSEGVQIGVVRSTFGVLGTWTTVHHHRHDPIGENGHQNVFSGDTHTDVIGPFWMRKVPFAGHPSDGPEEAE